MSEPFDGLGASLADVIDRLSREEITKAEAATALALILTATNDGDIGALVEEVIGVLGRVTGILPVEVPDDQDRPSNLIGAPDAYAWDRRRKIFWGPKDKETGWPEGDLMTEGKSALQVLIAAGILPAGSTPQDFADWLADSQIAKVQPFADAAAASATAADESAGDAAAAADLAIAARDAAVPAAQLATEKAAAAAEDAQQTADDRAAIAGAMPALAAALDAAEQTGLDRAAATAAAEATAADRQAVADAMPALAEAVEAAGTATTKAGEALGSAQGAETARAAAVAAQEAAEQARDEAQEIVGGDYLSVAQADLRYRKLADALEIADITGLAAALEGLATPADITAAIDALVDGAPAALDTLKELAQALEGSEDALAALVLAMGDKEDKAAKGQANGYAGLGADGKVPAGQLPTPPTVPVFATVAEVWAGAAGDKIVAPAIMKAALEFQAVAPVANVITLDGNAGINFVLSANLTANATLANPTNKKDGRDGKFDVAYDGSARTLSVGSDWKKLAKSDPIPTAANSRFTIIYSIRGADVFYSVLMKP